MKVPQNNSQEVESGRRHLVESGYGVESIQGDPGAQRQEEGRIVAVYLGPFSLL